MPQRCSPSAPVPCRPALGPIFPATRGENASLAVPISLTPQCAYGLYSLPILWVIRLLPAIDSYRNGSCLFGGALAGHGQSEGPPHDRRNAAVETF